MNQLQLLLLHKIAVMPDQLTLKIILRKWDLFNKNT